MSRVKQTKFPRHWFINVQMLLRHKGQGQLYSCSMGNVMPRDYLGIRDILLELIRTSKPLIENFGNQNFITLRSFFLQFLSFLHTKGRTDRTLSHLDKIQLDNFIIGNENNVLMFAKIYIICFKSNTFGGGSQNACWSEILTYTYFAFFSQRNLTC